MSPTGEGAVSLSQEKAHVKRGCHGAARWAGSWRVGGGLTVVGTQGLSSSLASLIVGSGRYWQPPYPLLGVSTGKVGSETLQGTGAGGLGGEAPAAQQRGGIL